MKTICVSNEFLFDEITTNSLIIRQLESETISEDYYETKHNDWLMIVRTN